VATEESIPLKFLQAILLELRNRGVVVSKKGRAGGYELSRPPEDITVGTVIRMIEGPLAPLPCARETNYRRCDECKDEQYLRHAHRDAPGARRGGAYSGQHHAGGRDSGSG
jgi:Rrf2 family protein